MRDVAIVGTAQSVHARRIDDRNEVEMLMPVLQELKDGLGVTQADLQLLEDRHQHLDLVAVVDAPGVDGLGRPDDGHVTHQTCSL